MRLSPVLGLFVELVHVRLELFPVYPPDAAPADLDGRELTRTDQRVHLRDAHAEVRGDVLEREEARLDLRTRLFRRRLTWHRPRITADNDGYMDLNLFATV